MRFIKTPGKLPPDDDVRISHTPSSKTTSITTVNNNAVLCRTCCLCKHDVSISAYSSEDSPYCPDCENALSEMIKWHKGQKTEMGAKSKETVRQLIKY